jgi:hypothetical protein
VSKFRTKRKLRLGRIGFLTPERADEILQRARSMPRMRHEWTDVGGQTHAVVIRVDTTDPVEAERRAAAAATPAEGEAWRRGAAFLREWGGEMRRAEAAGREGLEAAVAGDAERAFRKMAEAARIERAYGELGWATVNEGFDRMLAQARKHARALFGMVPLRTSAGGIVTVPADATDRPAHELTAVADAFHANCPICRGEREARPGEMVVIDGRAIDADVEATVRSWN